MTKSASLRPPPRMTAMKYLPMIALAAVAGLAVMLARPATMEAQTPPSVTITTPAAGITEGGTAVFTVTASPAPSADLSVTLTVSQTGAFVASGGTGTKTVTIGTSGSATYRVTTVDDSTSEDHGSVNVVVATGSGYTVGSPSSAIASVVDNDATVAFVANPRAIHDDAGSLFFVEFEITGTADYYYINTGSGTRGESTFDAGDVLVRDTGVSSLTILGRTWRVSVLCGRSASFQIRTSSEYTRGTPWFLSLTAAACPTTQSTPPSVPEQRPTPSVAYEQDVNDADGDGSTSDTVNDYGRQGRPANNAYYQWRCDDGGCFWQPSPNYTYSGPRVCTKDGTAPGAAGRYLTVGADESTPAGYTCP